MQQDDAGIIALVLLYDVKGREVEVSDIEGEPLEVARRMVKKVDSSVLQRKCYHKGGYYYFVYVRSGTIYVAASTQSDCQKLAFGVLRTIRGEYQSTYRYKTPEEADHSPRLEDVVRYLLDQVNDIGDAQKAKKAGRTFDDEEEGGKGKEKGKPTRRSMRKKKERRRARPPKINENQESLDGAAHVNLHSEDERKNKEDEESNETHAFLDDKDLEVDLQDALRSTLTAYVAHFGSSGDEAEVEVMPYDNETLKTALRASGVSEDYHETIAKPSPAKAILSCVGCSIVCPLCMPCWLAACVSEIWCGYHMRSMIAEEVLDWMALSRTGKHKEWRDLEEL